MIRQAWQSLSQKRPLEYLAFAFISILATTLSCYSIAEPAWDDTHGHRILDGHQGTSLVEFSLIARNYLKFGYLRTKLGQVTNYGRSESQDFRYRIDNPPLLPLLISLSFRLFGVQEWSARLIPLLSSIGLLFIVYWLGHKLGGKRVALVASFLFALLPMQIYYGKMPAPHILSSFFSWLTFAFYLCWIERGRKSRYYIGIYLSFLLAALSGWIGYFVVPPILLHYVACEYKRTRNLRFVFSFAIIPVVLFAVHLGWACLLEGQEGFNKLFDLFLFRALSGGASEGRFAFTMWDFHAAGYARSGLFFTGIICVLSILWLIGWLAAAFWKTWSHRDMFILALIVFGLSHNLVFRNLVYIHDFTMLFHFAPLFAMTAALGAQFTVNKVLANKRMWTIPFILAVGYCFGTQSTFALRQLHKVAILPDIYLLGTRINKITDESTKVLGSFGLDYRMGFYADRPWLVTTDLDTLIRLSQTDSRYSLYVSDSESMDGVDRKLKEYLVRNHPVETFYGYSFFNLQEAGSNTILQDSRIEHPAEVNFDDKLMFLGYNVEEVVQKKREPSWLDKYFNAHAELMPEYRTTFRITYFWQCLEEMEKDYTLVTQFEGHHGQTYRIDQSHQGVNGAYPTSMWQVGEVIREEYQVEIPADYPPIRYALWVGVRDGEEELEAVSDVEADEKDRVRLGEIEVLPAKSSAAPLAAEPRPQNRVEMNLNDELMFLGYDLNDKNPKPGDRLKFTTYWQGLRKTEMDYAIQVELRNGGYKVREVLDIAPTRLWEEGRYYQGDAVLAINPHLLEGTYSLNLRLDREDGTETQVSLASLDIPGQRRHIIRRLGKATYGGSEIISPDEPLSLRFNLKEKKNLELVVGWTGKAEGEETRVEVYLSQPYVSERYLGTWVIKSGRYTTTKRRIPNFLTTPGQNVIELRVPEARERVHNIGWRKWVDLVFPDLLQDPRTDYDGPIQMDFAQMSTRWEGNWDDYYDLAQVYVEREMNGEVARLYEEAAEKGIGPRRIDDFSLFKRAYKALGEEGKAREIAERIAERIAHKMSVNLGGKVEFLGYSLEEKGDGHGLSLFFRCLEEMEEDYTLWVHGEVEDESLLEEQRKEAGYAVFDHLLSTSRWGVGEVYQDDEVRGLKPGRYHFTLGLWRPEDGSRLWREDDPNTHIINLGWVEVW